MKLRKELPKNLKRIVVKFGSTSVSKIEGGLDGKKFKELLNGILKLHNSGLQIVIVCSGAINIGKPFLPAKKKEGIDIEYLQACSSIGQPILMEAFRKVLNKSNVQCSQVLLTHDDFKNRRRYLNMRNTLLKLLNHKVIPILNENDTVSFEEITVGDNDQLAAMTTELIDGDLLLMLTEADGLFNKNPDEPGAQVLPTILYDTKMTGVKTNKKTGAGRGGMKTKLQAVKKLTTIGIPVIISTYKKSTPILRALSKTVGTYFSPKIIKEKNRWKHWIFTTAKAKAHISIDEGAYKAIGKNSSLLPVGIKSVAGIFKRGDSVSVKYRNKIVGIGLSEYDSNDVIKIMGKKSSEIENILGRGPSSVVIHRDNYLEKD